MGTKYEMPAGMELPEYPGISLVFLEAMKARLQRRQVMLNDIQKSTFALEEAWHAGRRAMYEDLLIEFQRQKGG